VLREARLRSHFLLRTLKRALTDPRRFSGIGNAFSDEILFAGQTGHERFCNDILGERDTHTAGLYGAALKQLLIWNLPDKTAMLRTEQLLPTERFVAMPAKVFYRGSGRNYAQAWALVHFLRHGPEKWRPILPALLSSLASGKSPKSAVRVAFEGVDHKALHADLKTWLASLR
jgi:hypothetical protein